MKNQEMKTSEKENKYTLIINFPKLSAGGIETNLVGLMRYYLKEGHRVIWLTTSGCRDKTAFKSLTEASGLEIVIWEKAARYFSVPRIRFQENERVIMISCRAMHYVVGEELKRRARTQEFKHIYGVAHFTGEAYYPDTCMKTGFWKRITYRYWQKILKRMIDNGCLMGFAPKHLESYEAYYELLISDKLNRMIPLTEMPHFDEKNTNAREQERRERFVITTCARLEFPHKGYILGLVDSYCELKKKYPQVILQIIGDGPNGEELKEKIAGLPQDMQRDIRLTGIVSPDHLEAYYKDSHVIIGVAGAIVRGAMSGIPSAVVRHYCKECETYGFFENAWEQTLSTEKGEQITPLLEHCITMSREEYLQHGRAGFDILRAMDLNKMDYYFERRNARNTVTVQGLGERVLGRLLYIITEIKNRIYG